MRKNLFVISFIAVSANIYSFWEMKRIFDRYDSDTFKMNYYKDESLIPRTVIPTGNKITDINILYDENTCIFVKNVSYPLIASCDNLTKEKKIYEKRRDFLNCNFKYNNQFFKKQNIREINRELALAYNNCSLIHWQKQKLSFRGGIAKLNANSINPKLHNEATLSCELSGENWITLHKTWFSSSGIKILNSLSKKTVFLKKDKKTISLFNALRNYFKRSSDPTALIAAYCHYQEIKDPKERYAAYLKYLQPELMRLSNPLLEDTDFNFLKESRILTVWYLIPVEVEEGGIKKTIESQLLGLAKDKNGHLFHWVTDLGKDISVLMDYAPDISDEC